MKINKLSQLVIILCSMWSNAVFADTIKIGVAGPFSGPYVAAGDQEWQGAIQAADDINAQGGIDGKLIELIAADDSCNPEKAEAIARKFVQAGDIKAIVGHNCSSTTLAASKIYAAANMLMITPASTTTDITEHGYKSVFRTCGRDDAQGEVAALFMLKKLKAKRIVVINDGSIYGKVVASTTKQSIDKLGGDVILYQEISHDKTNNAELIKKITSLKPDVIYFGGLHTDAGNFLKYLREHKNNTTFFGSDGIASPDFVQTAGGPNSVKNVYMTFLNDPLTISDAKKVVKELQNRHITPTGYTLSSYAAVQAIAAAMENAPDNMVDWLHNNTVDSVVGPLEWDSKGDLKGVQFIVYKWNDEGGYEPYWSP